MSNRGNVAEITSIELGRGLCYQFHHTITEDETDQLDGQLTDGNRLMQLDISSLGDEYLSPEDVKKAATAWAEGRVLMKGPDEHHITSLIIPMPRLTLDGITEALRRFMP